MPTLSRHSSSRRSLALIWSITRRKIDVVMKPRIAIPIPHSTDIEYNERAWPQYATAVEQAGAKAIKIPLNISQAEVANLIRSCEGFLLPGSGADVNPQKYGQDCIPECNP